MEIKLTPDELRSSAQKYTSGSAQVTEVLTTLKQEQETIRSNWSGNAFTAFDEQFTELSPKIEQFAQLLEDINAQLNSVAQTLEDTDNELSNAIR